MALADAERNLERARNGMGVMGIRLKQQLDALEQELFFCTVAQREI